jgi:hypothetical protein
MMACFALADRLGVTLPTILAMTETEFLGWIAYSRLTAKPKA